MKKLFAIVALFLGLQSNAQDQISVGQIEFDGIKKVKRGAFWNLRPEAKEVFEKGYSTRKDVVVYKTTEVYLARFKDDEHNSQDGNYLAIPIGFTFYTKGSDSFPYDPECGNQFKYFKPLSQIKIINVPTPPPATACENHLKLKIYRWIDHNNQVVKSDSLVYEGFTSQSCKNIVDTSLFTTKVVVEKQQIEADDYEVEEKVTGNTTINNYTTNIYDQPQQGGQRRVYRQPQYQERRTGFRISVGYRGGGNISTPVITPRYDPGGLGGGGTRWDPPGNGGTNPRFDPIGNGRVRQVFDPAGIGG